MNSKNQSDSSKAWFDSRTILLNLACILVCAILFVISIIPHLEPFLDKEIYRLFMTIIGDYNDVLEPAIKWLKEAILLALMAVFKRNITLRKDTNTTINNDKLRDKLKGGKNG